MDVKELQSRARSITYPTIIDFMYPEKTLTPKYLDKLADLVLFYWEYRYDNLNIQLAEA